MKTNRFYTSAAVALLATLVATTSCKKDDDAAAPITPATLKHLNSLVNSGYYGNVKTITQYSFTNVKPNRDSTDVDASLLAALKPYSKSVSEYNTAGYITSQKQYQYKSVWNETTQQSEYTDTIRNDSRSEILYTYDDKNRILEQKYNYYLNDTVWRANSNVTTYTYDFTAKKVTVTRKNGLGADQNKYVYGLDDDGYIDQNVLNERYEAVPATFQQKPISVSKTTILSKDGTGNMTARTTFSSYYSQECSEYDDNWNCIGESVLRRFVNCGYTKYEYEYY